MNNSEWIEVVVRHRHAEAEGICSFHLVSSDNSHLPTFSAGSHIDVQIPGGFTRQYSLCNDSSENDHYLIAVLDDEASRGGSRTMHELVREGDVLWVSRPKNHFPLAPEALKSILFAGGIGVTPILCMAERLFNIAAKFEMHYCTRSKIRTAFWDYIKQAKFASSVHFHFDDGDPAQKLDTNLVLVDPEPGTHLYVCGPRSFMDAVLGSARSFGWQEQNLHYEFFSAERSSRTTDGAFDVKLSSSGRIVRVERGQSVAQALGAAGVGIPIACEQGVCGTCLTRVLYGEPDHKDLYLTPDEKAANDQFLPCCSRSKSELLVLDL